MPMQRTLDPESYKVPSWVSRFDHGSSSWQENRAFSNQYGFRAAWDTVGHLGEPKHQAFVCLQGVGIDGIDFITRSVFTRDPDFNFYLGGRNAAVGTLWRGFVSQLGSYSTGGNSLEAYILTLTCGHTTPDGVEFSGLEQSSEAHFATYWHRMDLGMPNLPAPYRNRFLPLHEKGDTVTFSMRMNRSCSLRSILRDCERIRGNLSWRY